MDCFVSLLLGGCLRLDLQVSGESNRNYQASSYSFKASQQLGPAHSSGTSIHSEASGHKPGLCGIQGILPSPFRTRATYIEEKGSHRFHYPEAKFIKRGVHPAEGRSGSKQWIRLKPS